MHNDPVGHVDLWGLQCPDESDNLYPKYTIEQINALKIWEGTSDLLSKLTTQAFEYTTMIEQKRYEIEVLNATVTQIKLQYKEQQALNQISLLQCFGAAVISAFEQPDLISAAASFLLNIDIQSLAENTADALSNPPLSKSDITEFINTTNSKISKLESEISELEAALKQNEILQKEAKEKMVECERIFYGTD